MVVRVAPRISGAHGPTITKAPSSKGVALFGQKNEDVRAHPSAFGMEPTHQGLETHHFIRRQVHDGLEVHDQFSGVQ
jgi:hypothetical protein